MAKYGTVKPYIIDQGRSGVVRRKGEASKGYRERKDEL